MCVSDCVFMRLCVLYMCMCVSWCDSWQQVCVLLCGGSGVRLTRGVEGGVGEGDSRTLALGLPRRLTAEEEGAARVCVDGCVSKRN